MKIKTQKNRIMMGRYLLLSFVLSLLVLTSPKAFAAGVYNGAPLSKVTILGTKFTPTGNAVNLKNTATGAVYEVLDIATANPKSLTFTVPSTTPPGSYTMKVGAFNSDWSNSLSFNVTSPKKPVVTVSTNPTTIQSGQSTTVTWSADGADTCTGTANATVLASWAKPGLSGSMTFVPTGNTTLTLTCKGIGSLSANATAVIIVNGGLKPTVTLTAKPLNITDGQGTTLAWTSYNATSCVGTSSGFSSPAWNATQPTSGSLYITPTQNSTLTLTCTGPGGTTAATTNITKPRARSTGDLSVSCSVTPLSTVWKQLVTFTAVPTGGTGTYTYSWTGSDGLVGSAPSVSTYYLQKPAPYTRTAEVTVTSGLQAVVAQCPSSAPGYVSINPYAPAASSGVVPMISSISSPQGTLGSKITLTGMSFGINGSSGAAVVLESGGKISYVKPKAITTINNQGATSLDFDFYPSLPLPSAIGTVYNVSVQNGLDAKSNSVQLTLVSPTAPPIITPTISQVSPSSGEAFSVVTLSGTGFNSNSVVIAKQGNYVATFVPDKTKVSPTSLTFTFVPTVTSGNFTFSVSNQGVKSNEAGFTLTIPVVEKPVIVPTTDPALRNLSAIGGATSIDLAWDDSGSMQGDIMPEQSQRDPVSGAWSSWTNSNSDGCDKDSCTIYIGVVPTATYKFRVRTYDSASRTYSAYSNETSPVSMTKNITVLPWTAPSVVSANSNLSYTLHWSGGPLAQPQADAWMVFLFLEKQGGGLTIGRDFFPTPLFSQWTGGSVSTPDSFLISSTTPPGVYNVYVGMYRGSSRQELIPGQGVTAENATSRRYLVGTITIDEELLNDVMPSAPAPRRAPVRVQTTSSVWDAIKRLFGF